MDSTSSVDEHVNEVMLACYYHLLSLPYLRRSWTFDVANTLACSISASRIDCCNVGDTQPTSAIAEQPPYGPLLTSKPANNTTTAAPPRTCYPIFPGSRLRVGSGSRSPTIISWDAQLPRVVSPIVRQRVHFVRPNRINKLFPHRELSPLRVDSRLLLSKCGTNFRRRCGRL